MPLGEVLKFPNGGFSLLYLLADAGQLKYTRAKVTVALSVVFRVDVPLSVHSPLFSPTRLCYPPTEVNFVYQLFFIVDHWLIRLLV